MTKIKVVTVPASMLPRPRQIESSDLKIGSCIDELAPALRAEIDKANEQSDAIKEWQKKKQKYILVNKKPRNGAFLFCKPDHSGCLVVEFKR